jgi:hypothetical protein
MYVRIMSVSVFQRFVSVWVGVRFLPVPVRTVRMLMV